MSRCWIETDPHPKRTIGVLTAVESRHALAFARLARDVYPDQINKDRGDATLVLNWVELLQSPKERVRRVNLAGLRTFLYRCFGFNAALYKLRQASGDCWVLSFEGSGNPLSFRGLPDWVLTNIPTVLSAGNELERYMPAGLFTKHLNPRNAPSTQYDIADLVTRRAIELKGKSNLVLTGHSLGGGLAQYAAISNGVRAIVFNSAGIGYRIPGSGDADMFSHSVCHLMTTGDASILRSLGQIVQGRLFQAVGATTAVAMPAFQREALTLYAVGSHLAAQPRSSFEMIGAFFDQQVNRVVTTYTKAGSKQVGTPYVIGYGGHGMEHIIDILRGGQPPGDVH